MISIDKKTDFLRSLSFFRLFELIWHLRITFLNSPKPKIKLDAHDHSNKMDKIEIFALEKGKLNK